MANLFVVGPNMDAGFIVGKEFEPLRNEIVKCAEMTDETTFYIDSKHLETFDFFGEDDYLCVNKFDLLVEEHDIDLVLESLTKAGAINDNSHGRYCAFTKPRAIHNTKLNWRKVGGPSEFMYVADLVKDTVNGGHIRAIATKEYFDIVDGHGELLDFNSCHVNSIEEAKLEAEKYWNENSSEILLDS